MLEDELSPQQLAEGRYMVLDAVPASLQAIGLTNSLALTLCRQMSDRKRSTPTVPFKEAVGALIADLLRNAEQDIRQFGYRPLRPSAFTGLGVGYRPVRVALDGLRKIGAIEVGCRGHQQWATPDFCDGPPYPLWRKATRFQATPWFFQVAEAYRITPANWRDHFELRPPMRVVSDPLVRRTSSVSVGRWKFRGNSMKIDYDNDPIACALRDQVNALNAFVAEQTITPACHRGFRRIFNEGDKSDFRWNKGGRLYSIGGGYQLMPKAMRREMTINGEPVAEIDIRASHLTILHGLKGEPFDAEAADPYAVPDIPREVVKALVAMTLGHKRFQRAWSRTAKEELEDELGCSLQKAYPIRETREKVLTALPVLADWPECALTCFDLQYIESCVLMETICSLAFEHRIVALPIHDSIIVPESSIEVACETLRDAFRRTVGLFPALKVNH